MRLRSGFTLIEIIASALLFAVGTMAIIAVIMHGLASAAKAQADATAWATAFAVLKDPLPLGATTGSDGQLRPWTWTHTGDGWSADDGSGVAVWQCTTWPLDQASDVLVPDMGDPQPNAAAVFPAGGQPLPGCARGWLNGYYVERREQSLAADRIGVATRVVEVRVDVFWAAAGGGDGQRLATTIDRVIRQGGL